MINSDKLATLSVSFCVNLRGMLACYIRQHLFVLIVKIIILNAYSTASETAMAFMFSGAYCHECSSYVIVPAISGSLLHVQVDD